MTVSRAIMIQHDGEEVGRRTLELFRLPDGTAGAKWGGLVFPLRQDDHIELIDCGTPPGQCIPWEERSETWSSSAEASATETYLYIEGSAQTCGLTVRNLEGAGIHVLRSGPNLSGNPGDWFIRLDAPIAENREKIASILAGIAPTVAPESGASLRERLLIQALAAAQESQVRLRRELDQARSASASRDEERILNQRLEGVSALLAEAQAEAEALRSRVEAAARPVSRSNRLEAELAIAAASMLPRIDFVGSSLGFLTTELPSRAFLWKALVALDRQERGQPAGWKPVAGYAGWWERHFSTGQDNQGRIYARLFGEPARWQVLVSHKQDQPGDIRRISRM